MIEFDVELQTLKDMGLSEQRVSEILADDKDPFWENIVTGSVHSPLNNLLCSFRLQQL